MADAARALFDSITTYRSVLDMIDRSEAEDQYLECKAPGGPQLGQDLKKKLAEAASGFANTGGGVILWGVQTDSQPASGLDLLTQIAPIGNVQRMLQRINVELPRLVVPQVAHAESKILKRNKQDTKGIIATYIPPTDGDPVQSTADRKFYIRTGDDLHEMPYETLQRMFTGAKAPVLRALFEPALIAVDPNGLWKIRVVVSNDATAVARDVCVTIEALNSDACETITCSGSLEDTSSINPGTVHFSEWFRRPIHRGLSLLTGTLLVKMKRSPRVRRRLDLGISLYADGMRARRWTYNIQLSSGEFQVRSAKDTYIE